MKDPLATAAIKRAIDIIGSMALLVLASPLFLVVPLFIKYESRGPVFFRQKRCGRGGGEFRMYKFRTMVEDAESLKKQVRNAVDGPMFKSIDDPRVTKVGRVLRRTSIDEVPQLYNVLRGDMSLVGPRPLAAEEMAGDEARAWREARLSVKPGLTGIWQLKGRSTHTFSDWVKYDMEYVDNRSLLLDLKLIFKTAVVIGFDLLYRRKHED